MTKKKILVVDDAENIRYLLKTVLELENFDVKTVSNGKDAISAIKKDKPDVMILDIMMPEMDGWEVAKTIKEDLKIDLPILMLTARTDDMSKKLSQKVYGVKAYMTKPFLKEDLVKEIKKIIK